jgi:RND family efflux transporter MFP subunit
MGFALRKRGWAGAAAAIAVAIGVIAVAVYGQASLAGWGFGKPKDDKAPVTLEFSPREVTQPVLTTMPARIEFSGPLVAPNTAVVRAKAAGTLVALDVAEGATVRSGQALGRIDLAELATRVAERNANLESARAALAQAERSHASNEHLAAQSFISPVALQTSRSQLESARAQLQAAQASLDTTRVLLREAALLAPISGIVAKRHVVPGEKVSSEQQLLTIVDLSRLELAGTVPTHEVSRLSPGMEARVEVEGFAQPVAARVARIAPAAEAGTRSIGVTLEIVQPKQTLRAGQYAIARILLADDKQRLTVPTLALASSGGQDYVWVLENGALLRRVVTLGRRDDASGRTEVLTGLTPQAQLLAVPFDNLREGAKAVVVGKQASALASAAASSAQAVRP